MLNSSVNNAGVLMLPYELTKDGVEIQVQSNYLGHFAFTLALLPQIIKTSRMPPEGSGSSGTTTGARIVNLTSEGHSVAFSDKECKELKFKSKEDLNKSF